jgi:hypothetical protein
MGRRASSRCQKKTSVISRYGVSWGRREPEADAPEGGGNVRCGVDDAYEPCVALLVRTRGGVVYTEFGWEREVCVIFEVRVQFNKNKTCEARADVLAPLDPV